MLQILNSKERNQAFLKFLLFFILTVILVVIAVFFDFWMPRRENKMLYSEISTQRQQEFSQQTFLENLEEAVILLDSLDNPQTNFNQIDTRLGRKLNEMQDMEGGFSTVNKKINKITIHRLGELHQQKINMRKMKTAAEALPGIKQELLECKSEVQALKADITRMNSGN